MVEILKHCMCGCIYEESECPNCNQVTDKDRIEELEAKLIRVVSTADALASRAKSVFEAEYYNTRHLEGSRHYYELNCKTLLEYHTTVAELKGQSDDS